MQSSQEFILTDLVMHKLYEQNAPLLLAFLLQRVRSREDAEDILVEVFVAAIEYPEIAQLSSGEQKSWLWRVAHNKIVDAYRYSKLRQGITLDTIDTLIHEDEKHTPEQVLLRQEEYNLLYAHLEKLPPIQQKAMQLRFAHGLRYAEIAEILGKRESAIRVMFSRTLNLLRKNYEKSQKGAKHVR